MVPLSEVCLMSVCLSVCLSVAYIGPKSRTERPRKTKIGTEVAHVTGDSDTTFKVNRTKVMVTRPLYSPPCLRVRQLQPASVAQLAETQCASTGTVCRRSRGSIPGSTGCFRVRISGARALRLISRAARQPGTFCYR